MNNNEYTPEDTNGILFLHQDSRRHYVPVGALLYSDERVAYIPAFGGDMELTKDVNAGRVDTLAAVSQFALEDVYLGISKRKGVDSTIKALLAEAARHKNIASVGPLPLGSTVGDKGFATAVKEFISAAQILAVSMAKAEVEGGMDFGTIVAPKYTQAID